MNLFQLVLKQMRERALGTSLTLLSVLLGVALAVAVLLARRESGRLFGQTDFGYEVLVGPPKGSPLQLTLNTVYHMDRSAGNVPYDVYEDLSRKRQVPGKPFYAPWVRLAVPFMVGDSYNGHRIVGTSPQMFGFDDDGKPFEGYDDRGRRLAAFQDPNVPERQRDPDQPVAASTMEYRRGKKYELAEGRVFHPRRFQAVIGSEVATRQKLKVGDKFKATHGMPAPGEEPDIHDLEWEVVGVLEPTRTANDGVLFIPVISLYAIEEHSSGLIQQAMIKAGINPDAVPPEMIPEVLKKLGFDPNEVPPKSVMKLFRRAGAAPKTGPASRPADGELLQPAGADQPIGELLRPTEPVPAAPAAPAPAAEPRQDEKAHSDGETHSDGTAHEEGDDHADHAQGDTHSDGTVHKEGDEHADHAHGDHNHAHAEAFHFDDGGRGEHRPGPAGGRVEVSAILVKTRRAVPDRSTALRPPGRQGRRGGGEPGGRDARVLRHVPPRQHAAAGGAGGPGERGGGRVDPRQHL